MSETKKKGVFKKCLLAGKLLLAGLLMLWVLSQAHWNDYAQLRPELGGQSFAVVADQAGVGPESLRVQEGLWWWAERKVLPLSDFQPVSHGEVVRRGIRSSLVRMRVVFFVLAVLAYPCTLTLMGVRLWYLLGAQSMPVSLWEAIKQTFLGQFFNQVVPGTVGGDLVKAWYISRQTGRTAATIVTLFVDRLMGLVELALMSAVMLAVVLCTGRETVEAMRLPLIAVAVVVGFAGLVLLFILSGRFRRLFHLQKIWGRLSIAHHFEAAGQSVTVFRERPVVLVVALLITVVAHVFFIGGAVMIGLALRMETPVLQYFVYVPLIYTLGAVPVTPGGVGLVERLYLEFFSSPAVGASTVVTLAMLARVLPALWGLPGLLVAIRAPKRPETDELEAELEAAENQETEGKKEM